MPRIFVVLFFCFNISMRLSGHVVAQNLHVFSVIESEDVSRPDRLIDADRLDKTSENVSKYLGLDRYTYDFGVNNAFSVSAVRATLQRVKKVSCSSDVIWFHFSGYGRNDGQSNLPVLKLTDGELELSEIITALQQKHPKLLLITIEAGNKRAEPKTFSNQAGEELTEAENTKLSRLKRAAIAPKVNVPAMKQIPHFSLIENYERLFKKYEGIRIVTLSSCSVGQNSVSNTALGSAWFMELCKSLEQMTDAYTRSASWESIQNQTLTEIQSKFKGQKPQATIRTIPTGCDTDNPGN